MIHCSREQCTINKTQTRMNTNTTTYSSEYIYKNPLLSEMVLDAFHSTHAAEITLCAISRNANAIHLFEQKQNRKKIMYHCLSINPNSDAVRMIPHDRLYWDNISQNPCELAVELMEKYPEKINNNMLSKNSGAGKLIRKTENLDKLNFRWLSQNASDEALDILESNIDKIEWTKFSFNSNPRAVRLLMKYPQNIDWDVFCSNTCPLATPIFEANIDKLYWYAICGNPCDSTFKMLLRYPSKINISALSTNTHKDAAKILEQFSHETH